MSYSDAAGVGADVGEGLLGGWTSWLGVTGGTAEEAASTPRAWEQ